MKFVDDDDDDGLFQIRTADQSDVAGQPRVVTSLGEDAGGRWVRSTSAKTKGLD